MKKPEQSTSLTKVVRIDEKHSESRTLGFHLKTMLLFTEGDFKCIIAPQSLFALSAAYSGAGSSPTENAISFAGGTAARAPLMLFWLWIHLLVVDMGNQRLPEAVAEDAMNKPWRPLPSRRLSPQEANSILGILAPLTVALSYCVGVFVPSVSLMALIWLYNELDAANAGPWKRNATNGVALACFGWGAFELLLLPGGSHVSELRDWVLLTAAINTTTIHAQDFRDMEGDQLRKRKTFPLIYNEAWVRATLAASVLFWSAVGLNFWKIQSLLAIAFVLCAGGMMAAVTLLCRGKWWDETVWKLWCFWTCMLYLLPCMVEWA